VSQGSGWDVGKLGQNDPITGNREVGGPIEVGGKERPRESEIPSQPAKVTKDQEVSQSRKSASEEDDGFDLPPDVDIKKRDPCRLIRALRKVAYELRGPREGKAKKPEKKVYRAFITLEDQVGIHHLSHRVGKKKEFQSTLQHPHQFRNTLIRVYQLKNLRWSLLRKVQDGSLLRMQVLMQILEEDAEYVLRIWEQKSKRPNAPGSRKRNHFQRANQKRGRKDFTWSPDQAGDFRRHDPTSHEARRSKDGHHEEGKSDRFT
jgi:hypothetical protein